MQNLKNYTYATMISTCKTKSWEDVYIFAKEYILLEEHLREKKMTMPNLNGKTEFENFKFWMWRNKKRERKICELVDK